MGAESLIGNAAPCPVGAELERAGNPSAEITDFPVRRLDNPPFRWYGTEAKPLPDKLSQTEEKGHGRDFQSV